MSNPFTRQQLFSQCSVIPQEKLGEPHRDRQLRSLLERDPTPLTNFISHRLATRHPRELYKASEAVFQTIFDEAMGDLQSTYANNYFTELGLHTHPEKKKIPYSDQSAHSEDPGDSRFSYLDMFYCGLKWLHPWRVIAVELKYISLYAIIRAKYATEALYNKAVHDNDDPNWNLEAHCKKTAQHLRSLSLEKLRAVNFVRWDQRQRKVVRSTVGDLLKDAHKQLDSYLQAIVSGNSSPNKKGITKADGRVTAKSAGRDEVVGMIFCGIGADIITICLDTRGTNFEYVGKAAKSIYD
ncbi:hypothetical protein DFH07DRAFT_836054 [Mycena maculata]|uniref:Uncharacterized protein n=1 Tax=Mycena maculata TaxID=230809 RepID=A0AAD7N1T1_9AGAR|nr:hypothetical protein DFH07DRAFT_836054 [Mycena maculata]